MSTRVLILYASIGTGHYHAANAIAEALREEYTDVDVQLADLFPDSDKRNLLQSILSYISTILLPDLYTTIWTHGTFCWLYTLAVSFSPNSFRLHRLLKKKDPDIVVCTHTFPCSVAVQWKKRLKPSLVIAAVATDYAFHKYWPLEQVDYYISSCDEASEMMVQRGISIRKIHTTGIPISSRNMASLKNPKSEKSITAIFGSRTSAPYKSLFPFLENLVNGMEQEPVLKVRWILVFGTNLKWLHFAHSRVQRRRAVNCIGYVDDLSTLIQSSDMVLTKPGGLTITEILAAGKPIVLMGKGSGQELANSNFILSNGCGILVEDPARIFTSVLTLFENSKQLDVYAKNAKKMGKPNAASDAARIILGLHYG